MAEQHPSDLTSVSTKVAVVETKIELLTDVLKEQRSAIDKHFDRLEKMFVETAREDRQEWIDATEKQNKAMVEKLDTQRKEFEEKYKELIPLKYKYAMAIGGLLVISYILNFARPLLEKLFHAL